MFVARGELIAQPRAKLAQTCASWPHGFVKMNSEPEEFISRFNTNRAHVVPGVHTESLENYCELMDIPVDKVSRSPAEPPGEPSSRALEAPPVTAPIPAGLSARCLPLASSIGAFRRRPCQSRKRAERLRSAPG